MKSPEPIPVEKTNTQDMKNYEKRKFKVINGTSKHRFGITIRCRELKYYENRNTNKQQRNQNFHHHHHNLSQQTLNEEENKGVISLSFVIHQKKIEHCR